MTVVEYQILMRDKFSRPIGNVNRKLDRFNRKMTQANVKSSRMQKKTGSLGKSFGKLGKFIGVAAVAYGAFRIASASVKGWNKQEKAISQVRQGLISTGHVSGQTLAKLEMDAANLQKNTLFGDEEILAGATAQLLTFTNITGDEFNRTQKSILDVATRLSAASDGAVDLKAVSLQLGKALNDPVANLSALSRSGIQFSKKQKTLIKSLWQTGKQAEAQRVILKELENQYGGSAEAAAKAGMGPMKQFRNYLGDIGEVIGSKLGPLLNKMAKGFMQFGEVAKKNFHHIKKAVQPVTQEIKNAFSAFGRLFKQIFKNNKQGEKTANIWKKIGRFLRLAYTPMRLFFRVLAKGIEWVRIGVVWFQKMYDKFALLRKVISVLLTPLKMVRDAFDWINRQLDKGKRQQLDELGKRIGKTKYLYDQKIIGEKKYREQMKKSALVYKMITGKMPEWASKYGIQVPGQEDMPGGAGMGGAGGTGGAGSKADITSEPYKITGAAPKIFNLNITKLIEKFEINTTNISQIPEQIKESVLNALMEAVVDVQTNIR